MKIIELQPNNTHLSDIKKRVLCVNGMKSIYIINIDVDLSNIRSLFLVLTTIVISAELRQFSVQSVRVAAE